jgi:hypothetical protein
VRKNTLLAAIGDEAPLLKVYKLPPSAGAV